MFYELAMCKTRYSSLYRCSVRSRFTDDLSVPFQPFSSFFSCPFSKETTDVVKYRRKQKEGEAKKEKNMKGVSFHYKLNSRLVGNGRIVLFQVEKGDARRKGKKNIYIYIQRYAVIWNDIYRREKSSNDGILRDKCSFDVDQFLNKITYLYLYSDAIKKIIDINKPSDRLNFSSLKFKIIYIYFSNFFKFRSINQKNFYHR